MPPRREVLVNLTNSVWPAILGAVKTITTYDAKTHLSRYLAEVEGGASITIARGSHPVALLVPVPEETKRPRPKVGEIQGDPFEFPDSAFAPLDEDGLREWGI